MSELRLKRPLPGPSCCALCQEVLVDPVSTSCGHWFCRQCIRSYWDQSAPSGPSFCPQCGERPRTGKRRPAENCLPCRGSARRSKLSHMDEKTD
uniref:RING-type domain-containing protein n=1 Tax=Poecilia reticulata TaxID=8081 RepID=A0A3P9P5X6_POERE